MRRPANREHDMRNLTYLSKEAASEACTKARELLKSGFYEARDSEGGTVAFFDEDKEGRKPFDPFTHVCIFEDGRLWRLCFETYPHGVDPEHDEAERSFIDSLVVPSHKLYECLKAAGCEISNHCSDLYVKIDEKSKPIVEAYEHKRSPNRFVNHLDGLPWFDIPFAYAPYWEAKAKGAKS